MLNYFLFQLVGPNRKSLRVHDPEKYNFRPKELLKQVLKSVENISSFFSFLAFFLGFFVPSKGGSSNSFISIFLPLDCDNIRQHFSERFSEPFP